MNFSIAAKQNFFYFLLVVLTSVGTILLYWNTQTDWILYRNAEIKFGEKDYESAIDLYKKSLEAGGTSPRIIEKLTNSYFAIGNFNEAITILREHLLNYPNDKKARLELARALSYTGNLEESEIEYKKTLEQSY